MDPLYSEAVLNNYAFQAEYSRNEDTGSDAKVCMSSIEEKTLESESQSFTGASDLVVLSQLQSFGKILYQQESTCTKYIP